MTTKQLPNATTTCPECLRSFRFNSSRGGTIANCPACKSPVNLPKVEIANAPVKPVPKPNVPTLKELPKPKNTIVNRKGGWYAVTLAICIFGISMSGPLLRYFFLFGIVLSMGGLIRQFPFQKSIVLTLAAIVLWLCAINDTFTTVRHDDYGGESVAIYEEFWRWRPYTPIWQSIVYPDSHRSGALTKSGKRHGEWRYVSKSERGTYKQSNWYWYGDEVTEGEFRSK